MTAIAIDFKSFGIEHELSTEDEKRICILSDFEMSWTGVDDLMVALDFDDKEKLIQWLRKQSINKVGGHQGKKTHNLNVIKTYSHDPVKKNIFIALCPLFTGRDYLWWD